MAKALLEILSSAGLEGDLIQPGHGQYDAARKIWNGTADKKPAAIIRATSEEDVHKTVQVAAETNALLAVRCGGHSLPGFSTCDGGIVLDLSRLNRVTVDPAARQARVGGGSLLGDLDRAGFPHGLVTPAGVVSHTGAAGLTLGGGMGWMGRRLGLTIDSLLSATVILADGRKVVASTEVNPDLFWGLRGGGGNFGVVTEFTFHSHDLGEVLVGNWTYSPTHATDALKAYAEHTTKAPTNLTTAFTLTKEALSVAVCWSGRGGDAGRTVAAYGVLQEPQTAQVGGMNFIQLQSRRDEQVRWGRRYYAKGGFLKELNKDAISTMTDAMKGAPTPDSEIHVNQLGGAISAVDENATAYSGRAANYYWIVQPVWDKPEDDLRCLAWGRSAAKTLSAISMATNYVNEQADSDGSVAKAAYGADKYARLARLKAAYDPGNLFKLNQNIEPARP
jgi:FAD/FMN-containing dehydrogenase